MSGGRILWKCRRCGSLDNSVHSPDVLMSLMCEVTGLKQPFAGASCMSMLSVHKCEEGKYGVSDLYGGDVTEPEKPRQAGNGKHS